MKHKHWLISITKPKSRQTCNITCSVKLRLSPPPPQSQHSLKPKASPKQHRVTQAKCLKWMIWVASKRWMVRKCEARGQREIWMIKKLRWNSPNPTQFITIINTLLRGKGRWWPNYPRVNSKRQRATTPIRTNHGPLKTREATKTFERLVHLKNTQIIQVRSTKRCTIFLRSLQMNLPTI